jgi:hypothetical protein
MRLYNVVAHHTEIPQVPQSIYGYFQWVTRKRYWQRQHEIAPTQSRQSRAMASPVILAIQLSLALRSRRILNR